MEPHFLQKIMNIEVSATFSGSNKKKSVARLLVSV